ncbi:Serine-threonine kinase receptor-associated protein [Halotydeus destructor]|nr:Serine-threonine kinase receptor-associated protein [Halotydeus destructor]
MSSFKQTPLTCSGHTRPVVHLAFSPLTSTGYYLISACKDGKPMLRQGDTGDWIGTFEGHKGAVWGVALNKDGSKAATASGDFSAKIWDAMSGTELHTLAHSHVVRSVDFSSDEKQLLSAGNEKLLKIYDLEKPDEAPNVIKGHSAAIRHAFFVNNDKWLISASDDKSIRFWDKASGSEIKKLEFAHVPSSIELSRNGSILAICSGTKASFWDVERLDKIKEFEIPTHVLSATLHHEKPMFVCGGEDFKMYKYNFDDGTEIESFKGHFGPVHCVRFSPDGELYASGSEDGTLRLWQTTVGKTYGLWKCTVPEDNQNNCDGNNEIGSGDNFLNPET